ncbi:TIR domain-containing protein [Pseudanabaena sp. UWO310]|uniref:TIR domain-containing protein n=1 Tax=Pseudanabaena sp. UWO310 TaxID=2480795 RepID=UPI00116031E6|nr:TIR domain-containing protein [Pseudanabaena sp. UWO310]TYQ24633.1 TIR domain-containing protein [Pseudanabaena sp. UWO310]
MNNELTAILDRIANGQFTDADKVTLRQFLESGEREVNTQFAKFNVNIGNGKDIHIGDKIYLELNDEIIRVIADKIFSANLNHGKPDKLISQPKSMNLPKNKPVYIYFSGCRQDEKTLKEIEKRLRDLETEGSIEILYTDKIPLGKKISDGRKEQLQKANIILLLVSTDFIISPEHREEVNIIMRQFNLEKAKVKIIPILVEECHWEGQPYRDLNPLPRDRKSIGSSKVRKSNIYYDIASEIRSEINKLKSQNG